MPKALSRPAYTLHKASGQARVRIDGKDHYLGEYGSPKSRDDYEDLIAEWLSRQDVTRLTLTINDLALLYLDHAAAYYRKNGEPTSEVGCIRSALRLLIDYAGRTRARDFGPRQFCAFRDSLIDRSDGRRKSGKRTLSRQYINKALRKIVRAFKWAAMNEHVPVSVWQGLTSVEGLKRGRSEAREAERVRPVEDEHVDAVLPFLSPPVAAMVTLQRLTGMRPGEVTAMRPCDVTRRLDGLWTYRPSRFKTEHHDDAERVVTLGPKAQAVLLPWLDRDPEAPCFSPREAVAWQQAQKRAKRKTPVQPSQQDRSKPKRKRELADSYSTDSYRQAIEYAVSRANAALRKQAEADGCDPADVAEIPNWHPNRIRHSVATIVREKYGIEAAQVTLGHAKADVTQVYAERNSKLAAGVMREIG